MACSILCVYARVHGGEGGVVVVAVIIRFLACLLVWGLFRGSVVAVVVVLCPLVVPYSVVLTAAWKNVVFFRVAFS